MMKSRRMRWKGDVAPMVRKEIYTGFRWEIQEEGDHWHNIDVVGRVILK
jgi:hypothetical protein